MQSTWIIIIKQAAVKIIFCLVNYSNKITGQFFEFFRIHWCLRSRSSPVFADVCFFDQRSFITKFIAKDLLADNNVPKIPDDVIIKAIRYFVDLFS